MNYIHRRSLSIISTLRPRANFALKLLALCLGCASPAAWAQSYVAGSPPNDAIAAQYFPYHFTTISSIKYGSASSEVGDIWLPDYNGKPIPPNSTSRPAVVVVHGGGGTSGSRNSTRELQISGFCAAHGYVAFNIDYPIGAVYPQNIQAWRLAVRFLRQNAATYGIDPNHIGITGGSFGGFCSAFMSGITNGQHTIWPDSNARYNNASLDLDSANDLAAYSGDIQCAIDLYGPVDQVTSGNATGQYSSPTQTTLSNSSSIYYVHATSAPLMIAHGTADTTVSISQSKEMTNYLGRFNVPYQFCVVQNAQHTFYYYQSSGGQWPPGNSVLDLRKTAFDWFDKYLLAAANPPTISVQPANRSGCSGYSASFSVTASGTAPLAYQWSGPSGAIANATNSTYTIASLSGGDAGTYSVTITNNFGSVTSSNATLTVNTATPPGITSQPTDTTVLAGNPTNLTVVATGDALQYQWYGPSGSIANATNATYAIASAANSDAGSYHVVVFNSCNAVTSSNATLTVGGPPTITGQPLSVVTCTGTSASFIAAAIGTAPLSYQWYSVNNGPIGGATTNTLTLNNLTVADSDNYYLVVTNGYGSATSSNALLTVSANSTVSITSQPTSTEVAVGATASFSVSVSGGGPYTYLWVKNDFDTISNNPSSTTDTLMLTNVAGTDSGTYYHCFINNDCFTASTTNATLTVDVGPSITQQPQSSTNNVNATVTLSVTAIGTMPLSYQWQTNGMDLPGATNSTLVFNSIQTYNAGAYDVVVTNNFGSVTSAVANVTVNVSTAGSVTANSAASVQSAANAAVDIDEQSVGYVKVKFATVGGTGTGMAKGYFGFDLTGQSPDTNSPATLSILGVSASGNTGIQTWGLLQSYPGMSSHLTWNTAQANDTTTNTLLTGGGFTGAKIGTNTPCAGGAVTNVITLPVGWGQFIVSNKLVLVLCPANPSGDSANGFRPNVTNLPTLNFNLAGQITTPNISTQPGSQAVCSNTPVNFTVLAGGAPPLSYQWRIGGAAIDPGVNPTATNATLSLTGTSPADNGSYDVVITNVYGAVTSSVATLTVSADPPVVISGQPSSTSGVVGGSASFTVTASGGTLTYQWYLGASPVSGGTNATLTLNNLTTNNAGSYTVLINNSCGNAASQAATLTVNIPPGISQQPQNQTVNSSGTANFSVTATGTTPLGYQWRKAGIPVNYATNSTYTIGTVSTNDAGSFDVVVTNSFGSITSAVATLTVVVVPPSTNGLPISARATVRDGANFYVDIDEQTAGYVLVKYSTTGSAAKGYFQFDLTGQNADTNSPATFRFVSYSSGGQQNVRLWALNQAYPGMNNSIVWATAQANDTNQASDSMLTSGPLTATVITNLFLIGGGGITNAITLPAPWGQFVQDNKLVLVFTADPAGSQTNSSAGYRIAVTNSATLPTLSFSTVNAVATPPLLNATFVLSNRLFCFTYTNGPGIGFTVLCTTNLSQPLASWTAVGPATETSAGNYQFCDPQATNSMQRFYRVQSP